MNKRQAQEGWFRGKKIRYKTWSKEEYIYRNMDTGSMLIRDGIHSGSNNYKSKMSHLLGGGHEDGWSIYREPEPELEPEPKPHSTGLLTMKEAWELLGKGGEIQVYWSKETPSRYRISESGLEVFNKTGKYWQQVSTLCFRMDELASDIQGIYGYLPAGTHDSFIKPASHTCACCGSKF